MCRRMLVQAREWWRGGEKGLGSVCNSEVEPNSPWREQMRAVQHEMRAARRRQGGLCLDFGVRIVKGHSF